MTILEVCCHNVMALEKCGTFSVNKEGWKLPLHLFPQKFHIIDSKHFFPSFHRVIESIQRHNDSVVEFVDQKFFIDSKLFVCFLTKKLGK